MASVKSLEYINETVLASASDKGDIKLWNFIDGTLIKKLTPFSNSISILNAAYNGRII